MTDHYTEMIAENGKLHNVAAATSGKMQSWADALEECKQRLEQTPLWADGTFRIMVWSPLDYIVCAMREQVQEIDRAVGIAPVITGQVQQPLEILPAMPTADGGCADDYADHYDSAFPVSEPADRSWLTDSEGHPLCVQDGHSMTLITRDAVQQWECPNCPQAFDPQSLEYYTRV